ncbi:hypothetical protein KUTeg_015557 [Tegillarca granosa]|uniref:Uncharacterized protein n=1 Tax=Tegillarca granosa TaxID=220873 RepID=A0ABQ9EQH8_TEGGR|nr:hypothetical protein KUTeg_015557 [Tegillarca granosa]
MLSIENVEKEKDQNLRCVTTGYNESNPGVLTFLFTNCYEKHQGVCIIETILSANKIKTSCSFFNVTKFNEGLNYNFYYSDCNVDRRYICRISEFKA